MPFGFGNKPECEDPAHDAQGSVDEKGRGRAQRLKQLQEGERDKEIESPVRHGGDARSFGFEVEANARIHEGLNANLSGTWLDGEYTNFFTSAGDQSGNRVQRQPRWQLRFTPNYNLPFSWGFANVYGTLTYVGDHFADVENTQLLPSYTKFDAGLIVGVGDRWTFQVSGDNLTDKLAIAEGNPRIIGSQGTGTILGRSFRFSLQYAF